jgi:hypothetical protein
MAQQLLFMILGWQTSDEKGGFNVVSRILGVQIDLAEAHLGVAAVHNVESRVRELVATIDEILGRGSLSMVEMRALRGRLVFAESQIFGRLAGAHMIQLSRFEGVMGDAPLDDSFRDSLTFLRDRVLSGEPRKILADVGRVYHLYTDASFEGGAGGLGGILFDENGAMLSFFSESMSPDDVSLLNPHEKKGLIFELETLATAIGVTQLLPQMAVRPCDRVVIFLDNEASLARLVSGVGSLTFDNALFGAILQWEFDVRAVCWYERVASHSNVADEPSRGKCDHLEPSLRINVDPTSFLRDLLSNSGTGYDRGAST